MSLSANRIPPSGQAPKNLLVQCFAGTCVRSKNRDHVEQFCSHGAWPARVIFSYPVIDSQCCGNARR
jgi:hypothetical protein